MQSAAKRSFTKWFSALATVWVSFVLFACFLSTQYPFWNGVLDETLADLDPWDLCAPIVGFFLFAWMGRRFFGEDPVRQQLWSLRTAIFGGVATALAVAMFHFFVSVPARKFDRVTAEHAAEMSKVVTRTREILNKAPNKEVLQKSGEFSADARDRILEKMKVAYDSQIRIHVSAQLADERSTRLYNLIAKIIEDAGFSLVLQPLAREIPTGTFKGIRVVTKQPLASPMAAAINQLYTELGETVRNYSLNPDLGENEIIIEIGSMPL